MIKFTKKMEAVVIGASAGGIEALKKILYDLPESFSLPVIIVLHLPAGQPSLLPGLFKHKLKLKVKEAEQLESIKGGTVYFAPPGHHLVIEKNKTFSLTLEAPVHFSRPSIDVLFESVAKSFGESLVGILLTGANEDGAMGLKKIKEAGGIAIVQNPICAEMPAMPAGGMPYASNEGILSLDKIADFLQQLNHVLPPKENIISASDKIEKLEILIVDDVKDNLLALNALLARDDVNIFQALSGNEALDLMLEHDFCLALLDVQMPVMNGFELAEFMRGTNNTKHIPIIFVTGTAKDQTHIFKGYESGAVDFLRKPIDPHTVKSKVNIFLELHQQKKELKNTAKELHQLNRTLKASTNIIHAIMLVKDETDYLKEVCRVIVEDCGHAMVRIGYTEKDDQKTIRPMASAGFDEGYLETLKLTWMDTERERGPTGNTIRSGEMSMCTNMLTDPAFLPWREEALKCGYASSVVFPLNQDGKTFGALAIFSKMPDPFSVAELELLTELTNRIAYGIVVLRLRTEKEKLDEARAQDQIEITNLNKNLQLQMKKLEESNQELEAFSSSVSHDLRSPLGAIGGFSRVLLEDYADKMDDKGKANLDRIINATQRMNRLIDDLLSMSRVSIAEMKCEKINLSEIAAIIAHRLEKAASQRQVQFIIADGLFNYGDENLLEVLLDNLISNAWKFTAKQTQAIIEFGVTEHEGSIAYFVKDNGAGFDMTYAEKLFMPFQRLHSMSEFQGTGLGLSIVRRIANRHGGSAWIEGEVGKGACVYFSMNMNF